MTDRACPVHQTVHSCHFTDDTLTRDLDAARAKLVTLDRLRKLREHPGYEAIVIRMRINAVMFAARASADADAGNAAETQKHHRIHQAYTLLLELLGGPRV